MPKLVVDADGFYTGRIVDHSISRNDETGSVTFKTRIALDKAYDNDTKTWDDISGHDYFVFGDFNMLGRGGNFGPTQKRTVQTIQDLFNWTDGLTETLQNMDISDVEVMVDVQTKTNDNGE